MKLIVSHCWYLQLPIDDPVQPESPVFRDRLSVHALGALLCLRVHVYVKQAGMHRHTHQLTPINTNIQAFGAILFSISYD